MNRVSTKPGEDSGQNRPAVHHNVRPYLPRMSGTWAELGVRGSSRNPKRGAVTPRMMSQAAKRLTTSSFHSTPLPSTPPSFAMPCSMHSGWRGPGSTSLRTRASAPSVVQHSNCALISGHRWLERGMLRALLEGVRSIALSLMDAHPRRAVGRTPVSVIHQADKALTITDLDRNPSQPRRLASCAATRPGQHRQVLLPDRMPTTLQGDQRRTRISLPRP